VLFLSHKKEKGIPSREGFISFSAVQMEKGLIKNPTVPSRFWSARCGLWRSLKVGIQWGDTTTAVNRRNVAASQNANTVKVN